jgi:hypothetical protein
MSNLKELIGNYDLASTEVDEKKLALEQSIARRSDVVRLISIEIAPSKKFLRSGQEYTIVVRGDLYFLRGKRSSSELMDADV